MESWESIKKELEFSRATMDNTLKKYEKNMCKTCRFYEGTCTKNRNILKCAKQGSKNKE